MAPASTRNEEAFRDAETVLGFYGDREVSWSILLEADLTRAVSAETVQDRLSTLRSTRANLGEVPTVRTPASATGATSSSVATGSIPPNTSTGWAALRADFAERPYGPDEPLLRVAVDHEGERLLLAAHHGAIDGVGLLGLLNVALDERLRGTARGVSVRSFPGAFPLSAARRAVEALFAPPHRVAADQPSVPDAASEVLVSSVLDEIPKLNTALLVTAATRAVTDFNRARGAQAHRIVAAIGASKRPSAPPTLEHASTYLRLRAPANADVDHITAKLARTRPEPEFPPSNSRLARRVTSLAAQRLGSTFLASNLGLVHAGETVRALRFHPAASGPSGIAFGLTGMPRSACVTARARGHDFSRSAIEELLDRLLHALRA